LQSGKHLPDSTISAFDLSDKPDFLSCGAILIPTGTAVKLRNDASSEVGIGWILQRIFEER
jgi:hypothetical protein